MRLDAGARAIVASAGRISTTDGSALEVLSKSDGGEKDLRLIGKVLSLSLIHIFRPCRGMGVL